RPDRVWRRLRRDLHGPAPGRRRRGHRACCRQRCRRAQRRLPRGERARPAPARRTGGGLMQVIPVPAHLDDRSLDQLASALGAWPPEGPVLVDAHATEWASPAGLTALLTLGQALREAGCPTPRLALPTADGVASYWAKAGFLRFAEELFELH